MGKINLLTKKEEAEKNCIKLFTRKELAEIIGVTEGTLAVWACNKRYNLKFIKVGRLVKYRLSDVLEFLEQRTQNNNSNSESK